MSDNGKLALLAATVLEALPDRKHWPATPRWWIGLSGGLDSTVLLHLLVALREQHRLPPLVALHVNHQLNPGSSQWVAHCQRICQQLDVELVTRDVCVEAAGEGPEAAARSARYSVFDEVLGAGELLLLAHHHDDQVETFFLRLLRGAGTLGLGGMPRQRSLGAASLLRPLLDRRRSELEAYARQQQLEWVEDDSNLDQSLDRNYLRHSVLPVLEQRWPAYRGSIEQAMSAITAAEVELERYLRPGLTAACGQYLGEPVLELAPFADMEADTFCRLLRLWITDLGGVLPGRSKLQELVRQLRSAEPDSSPQLDCGDYCLQRYRDRLHYRIGAAQPIALPEQLRPDQPVLVPGLGELVMRRCEQPGARAPAAGFWRLGFRSGGERCHPCGRQHSQSLKKLLQEYGVPPWQRQSVPLLYDGSELVAVGDLFLCQGHQSGPGEASYLLEVRSNFDAPAD
jgi:tRNA(Ile)-lysidine synthase